METYTVITDWEPFKKFIFESLSSYNKDSVGFLHFDREIYIRSFSQDILTTIQRKYNLTPCEKPQTIFETRHWEYLGNAGLFDL